MSVLLTACKAKAKAKAAKPKSAKKKKCPTYPPSGPPLSTSKTVVWHFNLQGLECTLMLDTNTNNVWCNGEDLITVDRFSSGTDGSATDFSIVLEDGSYHTGCINRVLGHCREMRHQLTVDGTAIQERTHHNQGIQSISAGGGNDQVYDQPVYDQAATQPYDGSYGTNGYAANSYAGGGGNYSGQNASAYGEYNGGQASVYNSLPAAAMYDEPPPRYEVFESKKGQ